MKIVSFTCYQVPPRWLFLKITTDEGIEGWGEPVIEGRAATVKAAVEELGAMLVGKDPLRIEDHWQMMYRGGFYRGGPILMSAIAGIDQALWDIKGKALNTPVYQLLGGACRDSIRVYSWIGGDHPSEVGKAAKDVVALGFTAVKMNGTNELQIVDSYREIDAAVARIAEVRAAVGPDIGIGIDFHGRVHKPMAKVLAKELEPYRPMFIEEPVLPENTRRFAKSPITRISRLLLASGCSPAGISNKYWQTVTSISSSRTCRTPAVSPSARRSLRWPRLMT